MMSVFSRYKTVLVHILMSTLILCAPFILLTRNEGFSFTHFLFRVQMPTCMLIIYYINYLWLVPKLFLKNRKVPFFLSNLLVIIILCSTQAASGILMSKMLPDPSIPAESPAEVHHKHNHPHRHGEPSQLETISFFLFRDFMSLAVSMGAAMFFRTNKALLQAEKARKEAELGRAEAELKSLRNQISPHFLLNTLNNIYALIQFAPEKAQATVKDLSQLLRFALYDNQQSTVSLFKEIEFEERYVNLMRIRMPQHTDIRFEHDLHATHDLQIMPLTYISLIENAFKHGIRTSGENCFIHICMQVKDESIIYFKIVNSNYPKSDRDRSGSGIGLEQVQKRLELTYPQRYIWEKGVSDNGRTYSSELIIETNPNKQLV